ncbi:hypothetical protein ACHAP5_003821 [Fusarium lateritium]
MSDPKVAQAIADGRVPKEITADYLNETKDAPAIAGIIFVTCLTSIVVLGRLASRALLIRRFGFDDALTLLSWRQFVGVAYLRPAVVWDSNCHASGAGDATEEKDPAGLYLAAGNFVSFAYNGESAVANGVSVIAISIVRLVFVIEGQWNADMSWAYNPMLAIEVSEIGATLIALSVPGVKPLFDKFILRRDVTQGESTGKSRYGQNPSSKGGTALRSLNFRPEHDVLTSRDTSAEGVKPYRNNNVTTDNQSENSADGILVQVDFRLKEDTQDGRAGSNAGRSWK